MRVSWREGREGATLIGERSFLAEGKVRKDQGPETGKCISYIKKYDLCSETVDLPE